MASKTQEIDTDASGWEYNTFAPKGETCPDCKQPIASLDRCRRGTFERQSGAPAVVYRHIDCADPRGLRFGQPTPKVRRR